MWKFQILLKNIVRFFIIKVKKNLLFCLTFTDMYAKSGCFLVPSFSCHQYFSNDCFILKRSSTFRKCIFRKFWNPIYKISGASTNPHKLYVRIYCFAFTLSSEIHNTKHTRELRKFMEDVQLLRIRIRSDPFFLGHPDSDPGTYRIRIRILYKQKDPCNSNFVVIQNSVNYSFVKISTVSSK